MVLSDPLWCPTVVVLEEKYKKFYSRSTKLISVKGKVNYSTPSAWIKMKITFSLINSIGLCMRGSKIVFSYIFEKSISADAKTSEIEVLYPQGSITTLNP